MEMAGAEAAHLPNIAAFFDVYPRGGPLRELAALSTALLKFLRVGICVYGPPREFAERRIRSTSDHAPLAPTR